MTLLIEIDTHLTIEDLNKLKEALKTTTGNDYTIQLTSKKIRFVKTTDADKSPADAVYDELNTRTGGPEI